MSRPGHNRHRLLTNLRDVDMVSRRRTMSSALVVLYFLFFVPGCQCNTDAKRLYDDLISRYNKLVRPVVNESKPVTVHIKLKLSQLIEVNLKDQIMTTNLWVEQYWYDYKLTWDPDEYGGVDMLHVPSEDIWQPDVVLYNNADGNFEVAADTKVILKSDGLIQWNPPAIYKSSCEIDVEYFPFDEQTCVMKFGSWTYDGHRVDLRHRDEVSSSDVIDIGIDLTEFYLSVEWDILKVPAIRNVKFYRCCDEPYIDITFNVSMRRKTLFYTVNLIIPCMGISFLTVLVFYLPSDSGEKVQLSVSILVSLTVFFLLLAEIIPPTSLVVPLLGKYLLFTIILVTLSIIVTVVVLNVHFRSNKTHTMSPWVKRVFLHILPRLLMVKRPAYSTAKLVPRATSAALKAVSSYANTSLLDIVDIEAFDREMASQFQPQNYSASNIRPKKNASSVTFKGLGASDSISSDGQFEMEQFKFDQPGTSASSGGFEASNLNGSNEEGMKQQQQQPPQPQLRVHFCPEFINAMESIHLVADGIRDSNQDTDYREDWKYVAMVLDRLFLWIFTMAVLVGTCGIILHAPTLYDNREAVDVKLSKVAFSFDNVNQRDFIN